MFKSHLKSLNTDLVFWSECNEKFSYLVVLHGPGSVAVVYDDDLFAVLQNAIHQLPAEVDQEVGVVELIAFLDGLSQHATPHLKEIVLF